VRMQDLRAVLLATPARVPGGALLVG